MGGPSTSSQSLFSKRLNQTEFEKLESDLLLKKIVTLKMDSQEFQAEKKNLVALYEANNDRFPNQVPKYAAEKRILKAKMDAGEAFLMPAQDGVVGKAYNWMLDRLPEKVRKSGQVENFRLRAESVATLLGPSGEPGTELAAMVPAGRVLGAATKAVTAIKASEAVSPLIAKALPTVEKISAARNLSKQMAGLAEEYGHQLVELQKCGRLDIKHSLGKAGEINSQLLKLETRFNELQKGMFELIPKDILQSMKKLDSDMLKSDILGQAKNYLRVKGIQVDFGKIFGNLAA